MENRNLEAIIRKYLDGDRGPAILARLNAAAWECFHDPWESRPEPLMEDLEAEEIPEPQPRPARPRRPSEATITLLTAHLTAYLEVHRWPFTRDETHAFDGTPAFCGMEGRDLTLRLAPDGPNPRILRFEMTSSWPVPEGAREEAGVFCHHWNHTGHSLLARLNGPQGQLTLRDDFVLPQRVTLPALVAFLDGCVVSAREFWEVAREAAQGWGKDPE